jgi:hypothetical protein
MKSIGLPSSEMHGLTSDADVCTTNATIAHQARGDELRCPRRNREADSLRARDDCRIHADDVTARRHEGTARVSWVQGGVGLDNALDETTRLRAHRPPKRAECVVPSLNVARIESAR